MIEVELFLSQPVIPFLERDPLDPLSGWECLGKFRLLDLPSVGDQISIAPGQLLRIKAVMHLAECARAGQKQAPVVRLMVDVLMATDHVGPTR